MRISNTASPNLSDVYKFNSGNSHQNEKRFRAGTVNSVPEERKIFSHTTLAY